MAFTDEEMAYIRSQPIARFATVGEGDQPDVVPVAFEFDGGRFWIGGLGTAVTRTRRYRNIAKGRAKVALVIDDLVSFDPFNARSIRVHGIAEQPFEREGMIGPGTYIRITPTVSWSWNMGGEPVGAHWYEARKTTHDLAAGQD